ncbi:MAG: hypothetical protein JXR10_11200 [Cyclobacteriaceae bacterium]
MKFTQSILCLYLIGFFVKGQSFTNWYSESNNDGIIIQNSYPKGGPYTGATERDFNHSYLVFFTRIVNETESLLDLSVSFSADPIAIPNSSDTFMKLFLPADTMTLDKRSLFSYGITELGSLDQATSYQRRLAPQEDCLFYVVALFYQTSPREWSHERGGNRAELVLKGQDLFYNIPPQVDALPCGQITIGD